MPFRYSYCYTQKAICPSPHGRANRRHTVAMRGRQSPLGESSAKKGPSGANRSAPATISCGAKLGFRAVLGSIGRRVACFSTGAPRPGHTEAEACLEQSVDRPVRVSVCRPSPRWLRPRRSSTTDRPASHMRSQVRRADRAASSEPACRSSRLPRRTWSTG